MSNPCAYCKNNKCETNNGNYCTHGCIDGILGGTCEKECPANCETCTQNSVDTGLKCTTCPLGKYSGRSKDESGLPYHDDCRHDCRERCASCTSHHWHNCTKCINGRFGTECQYNCYSGCEGGQCDKIDGKCTCKTGYASHFCKYMYLL